MSLTGSLSIQMENRLQYNLISLLDPRKPRGEHMPLTEPIAFTSASAETLLGKSSSVAIWLWFH